MKNSPPQRSAGKAVEQRIEPSTEQRTEQRTEKRTEKRSDQRLRNVVNCAISVQSRSNTVCAVEYLKSHNIGADVIERVLSHPEQRRACTQ